MNAPSTNQEAAALAAGEQAEKKGDPPVLRSEKLTLWPTKGEKFQLSGSFEGQRVLGKVGVNPRTQLAYVEVVAVEGRGDASKYTQLGFGHAVNKTSTGGDVRPVAPADGVRRVIFDLANKDGEKETFSAFITQAMTPDFFKKLGFEGEMTTTRKAKAKDSDEPADASAAPRP